MDSKIAAHIRALDLALAVEKGQDITETLKAKGINLSAEIAPLTKTKKPETGETLLGKRKIDDVVECKETTSSFVPEIKQETQTKKLTKKQRIAKLQASFVKDPRSYVQATATIINEQHPQWDVRFQKLPKEIQFAIATPYTTVTLNKKCKSFLEEIPIPHLRFCLNVFYANRNPKYGTQRKFTSRDSKADLITFLLKEKEINTSVIRNIFRYWLLEHEHPLFATFQVV